MKNLLILLITLVAGLIGLMALFPEQVTKLGMSAERSPTTVAAGRSGHHERYRPHADPGASR